MEKIQNISGSESEDIEFEESFSAWSALQDSGTNLWELDLMDDDEKRESYENAGLSSEDYCETYEKDFTDFRVEADRQSLHIHFIQLAWQLAYLPWSALWHNTDFHLAQDKSAT